MITLDGHVVGVWKRDGTKPNAAIETRLVVKLDAAAHKALTAETQRVRAFFGADRSLRPRAR